MTNKELITKDEIRDIFLRNGFTIKEGQTDLKDYVYAAAGDVVILTSIRLQEGLRESLRHALKQGGEAFRQRNPDAVEALELMISLYTTGIDNLSTVQSQIAKIRDTKH